jgi:ABC-type amino acid transport substrate-binding protein
LTLRRLPSASRALAAAAALLLPGLSRAETIELAFPEEPSVEQGPGHFAFDYLRAAEMVAADSGLTVRWVSLPNPRSVHRLQQNDANFCVGGAGITPERRELGKFTQPFIIDRMIGVIAVKSHKPDMDHAHSLADLIHHSHGDFLAYTGFNYGDQVTPQVEALRQQNRLSDVPHNTGQMLDMLKRGRAEYGFVSETYVRNYLATQPDGGAFIVRAYPDTRRDFQLGFLCSKATSDEVMTKLDQAVQRQMAAIEARFPDQAK